MHSTMIALVMAVLVAVAVSTPCTDQCNGACTVAKTGCDGAVVLGPLCDISFGMCSQGCTTICGCVDGCQAQCAPALTACNEKAPNVLAKAQCVIENDVCIADCQGICGTQQVDAAVQGLVSQALGFVMPRK